MEIGRAGARVGLLQLLPILDVKADWRLILLEHPGVHGENERLALRLQRLGERGQRAIGLAVAPAQKQANIVMPRIEGADGELRGVEGFWRAGGLGRLRAVDMTQENNQGGGAATPHHRVSILRRGPNSRAEIMSVARRLSLPRASRHQVSSAPRAGWRDPGLSGGRFTTSRMTRRASPIAIRGGRLRARAQSTLPGFITPFGSSAALISRITARDAGSFERASSPRLAGRCRARRRYEPPRRATIPCTISFIASQRSRKACLVGADRLRHVEMDVAVAEMAEGDDAGARRESFDRRRRLADKPGTSADRDRDVVLDRPAFLDLRLGNAIRASARTLRAARARRRSTRRR